MGTTPDTTPDAEEIERRLGLWSADSVAALGDACYAYDDEAHHPQGVDAVGAATRSLAQAGYQVVPIPPGYTWTVITALPDMDDREERTGNLATAFGSLYVPTADQRDEMNPTRWERSPAGLGCRVPVFALGEILLCAGGREITGHGRKPSKWGVEYETFTDLTAAMARAAEVTP